MQNNNNQKEILLVLNTRFFSRNWAKRNPGAADRNFSDTEKLIDACWNGITPQLLPEFFANARDKAIILWKINSADTFIDLEFYEGAQKQQKEFAVNPYVFLEVQSYS